MSRGRLAAGLGVALLGACFLALGQAVATGPPAQADPVAGCSTSVGAIVAVDFTPFRGDVERGCSIHLTTEYAAMHEAGFTTEGDGTDGPAFVCRIDGDPPPSQQSCATTPPADAYWSFWWADAGATNWSYSAQGAMGFEPQPGSAAAWVFGATGSRPTVPPSAVLAGNTLPTTTTTTAPTTTTTPSVTTTTASAARATTTTTPSVTTTTASTGNGGASASTTTQPVATSTSAPSSATATTEPGGKAGGSADGKGSNTGGSGKSPLGTPAPQGPKIVDVGPAKSGAGSNAGSPVPFLVGGLLITAVSGAGLVVARRRRNA